MPEMPEVEGLRHFLAGRLVGATLIRVELAAFSALKTFALPLTSLQGREVTAVERRGKFLALGFDDSWLVFHLARAGWLTWRAPAPAAPARPGKGPLALRAVFEPGDPASAEPSAVAFDLTEAGTQKHLAVYVVASLAAVPGIAALGPDPLAEGFTEADFAAVLAGAGRAQIKGVLRDQRAFAGIGNAWSDEILFAARLSPYALCSSLSPDQIGRLYAATRSGLGAAVERARGLIPSELKDDKRRNLRVHGRRGEPCPVCGTPIGEVSFADSALHYCPTCQTGGRVLADRRMSRLLK